jgi:hypothetical protein
LCGALSFPSFVGRGFLHYFQTSEIVPELEANDVHLQQMQFVSEYAGYHEKDAATVR